MARRPLKRTRKVVTEATRWAVYDDAGVMVGVIDLHPSPDVGNRFLAKVVSHYGLTTIGNDLQAAYRTLWAAARAIRTRAGRLPGAPPGGQ